MASRTSNRDRIQRMALEAEATKKEKAEKAKPKKKAKKAAPRKKAATKKVPAKKVKTKRAATRKAASRKKAGAKGRVKIVWAVCVPAGKALKIFPYREKAGAQAEADRLTAKKGTLHVLRSERQPMADDE